MGCITYTPVFEEFGGGRNVFCFSAGRGCHGTEPGIDAREVGVQFPEAAIPSVLRDGQPSLLIDGVGSDAIFIPRQTHSVNVCWADGPGEVPATDAVITRRHGLCVAVKTADCIPVLLYDRRQQLVAAVHAGWRGTVGRIVEVTIREMQSRGEDLCAIIGPGISLDAFEVGDEVYEAFLSAGFPMERIARRYPAMNSEQGTKPSEQGKTLPSEQDTKPSEQGTTMNYELCTMNSSKWHLDLWEANRWLLEQQGVDRIHVAGVCTFSHYDEWYSARRESIKTGRNINGIMLV